MIEKRPIAEAIAARASDGERPRPNARRRMLRDNAPLRHRPSVRRRDGSMRHRMYARAQRERAQARGPIPRDRRCGQAPRTASERPGTVSGPVAPSISPGPTRCTIRPPSTRRATVRPFRKAVGVAPVARSCARRSIKLPCNATMPANALIQSHLSGLAPMAANQLSDGAGWLPSVLAWFEDFVAV